MLTNYADEFYEADDIYGFVNDELEELKDLDADDVDREIMETILDEIPNAQRQTISPSTYESTSPQQSNQLHHQQSNQMLIIIIQRQLLAKMQYQPSLQLQRIQYSNN